jgi:hypothetical protein
VVERESEPLRSLVWLWAQVKHGVYIIGKTIRALLKDFNVIRPHLPREAETLGANPF